MDKLSTYIDNSNNIVDILNHAQQIQIISASRYQELSRNLDSFTKELVLLFNQKNSTSLYREEFIQVLDTLNYMFVHSVQSDNDITLLKHKSIQEYFYQGLEIVQEDEKQIRELFQKVEKIQLPFPNDRYQSIVNEQVTNYLNSLKTNKSWFCYGVVEDDLDYPLVDGTPLYHSMYYMQGSDLILFYLKNFHLEQVFLEAYKDEIEELLLEFEIVKGVSVEWIDINLFELVINQRITASLLDINSTILLKETDIERLHKMYNNQQLTHDSICLAIERIVESCDASVKAYILHHQTLLVQHYLSALEINSNFLIYEVLTHKDVLKINIEDREPSKFNYLSAKLNSYSSLDDKIMQMSQADLNVFDLIDLLESNIFMNDEYLLFFQTTKPLVLAVLIKLRNPELTSFHQQVNLANQLDELSTSSDWESKLVEYLSSLTIEQLNYIDSYINQIEF